MPDGFQRGAADFANTLGDHIGHGEQLAGLLIQQRVVVAKMRAAHVPVKILRLEVDGVHIGQYTI